MKRTLVWLFGTVLLFAVFMLPNGTVSASGLTGFCSADPAVAQAGTFITVTCEGFVPGEITNTWFTEPDGSVFSGSVGDLADTKVDAKGVVVFHVFTGYKFFKYALGPWALTVKSKSVIGIARYRLTGGTEGVSGASLVIVGRELTGSGFAPNEIVTVWFDFPGGDCSSNWFSTEASVSLAVGASTAFGTDLKADAGGNISTFIPLGPPDEGFDCAGFYLIVARGNSSHRGASAYFKTENHDTKETALLVPSKNAVFAFHERIDFFGSGFEPFETVTCWDTTPQGANPPEGDENVDANGKFTTGFFTGDVDSMTNVAFSNGALGIWRLTCRGK